MIGLEWSLRHPHCQVLPKLGSCQILQSCSFIAHLEMRVCLRRSRATLKFMDGSWLRWVLNAPFPSVSTDAIWPVLPCNHGWCSFAFCSYEPRTKQWLGRSPSPPAYTCFPCSFNSWGQEWTWIGQPLPARLSPFNFSFQDQFRFPSIGEKRGLSVMHLPSKRGGVYSALHSDGLGRSTLINLPLPRP